MKNNKIYTYLATVEHINVESELKLVLLWMENWRKLGYEPKVLNEHVARQHPYFAEFEKGLEHLPTVNPPGYERACYMRWLAMAQVGGGLMSDYDVFNYGALPPDNEAPHGPLVIFDRTAPCLVYGPANAFLDQCKRFVAYQMTPSDQANGQPHTSDMYILEMQEARADVINMDLVRCYLDPGWDTAQFVHYSNSSMTPAGKRPRYLHIPQLRTV